MMMLAGQCFGATEISLGQHATQTTARIITRSGASHVAGIGSRGKVARNTRKIANGATYLAEGCSSSQFCNCESVDDRRPSANLVYEAPNLVLLIRRCIPHGLLRFVFCALAVAFLQQSHGQVEMKSWILWVILNDLLENL